MSKPLKMDRRSVRTRAALRSALMTLIVEKGYEAITIQEIADQADVNRATFYLHYDDKDDLLYKSMEEVYNQLVESAQLTDQTAIESGDFSVLHDYSDWEHLAEHKEFYRVILSERGSASFIVKVRRFLANLMLENYLKCFLPHNAQPRYPLEVIAYACAGAQIGVMTWWIESDSPYPPPEMADMVFDIMSFGIVNAMGIPNPPITLGG